MPKVYYGHMEKAQYSGELNWSPSQAYPEYPFHDLSKERNPAYELIREGFHALGMDAEHFGTGEWNPLGDMIRPGMTVLLKPNWVMHRNDDPSHDMSCMVTHPSVIRAVLDYVVIALKGTGKIIVGDAPIQLCDFDALQKNMGYDRLWDYYRLKGQPLEVLDFRGLVAVKSPGGMRVKKDKQDGITVDLGRKSLFFGWSEEKIRRLRVTNYATSLMRRHHNAEKHEYMINPNVLCADVILNLPKPKSHRKAGLTACAKNFVGACMRKEDLPHHTVGAREEDGDEYLKHSRLHAVQSRIIDKRNDSDYAGQKRFFLYKMAYLATRAIQKATGSGKSDFFEGSWYGNDTIWRTVVDLNRIIRFADKNGVLQAEPQRRIFNVCDMIVSGEGEGPMLPSPKPLGAIVMGENVWAADRFICRLAGFSHTAVRYIDHLPDCLEANAIAVFDSMLGERPFIDCKFDQANYFLPTSGWRGHIEIDETSGRKA